MAVALVVIGGAELVEVVNDGLPTIPVPVPVPVCVGMGMGTY